MAKDPAFLLYSKDWLQGTAKLFPAEKGVFIDLLAHQHQDGFLPANKKRLAKMVGLSEAEFNEIWEILKDKFFEENGNLYNEKLISVMTDRGDHGEMRAIIGTFGVLSKSLVCSPEDKQRISSLFNYERFLGIERAKLSKTISKWLSKCLANDGDANEDVIEDEFNNKPFAKDFKELPEIKNGSVVELFKITKQTDITPEQVNGLWNVFKIQNLNGKKYYPDEDAVYSHFINWSKLQKIEKYGTGNSKSGSGNNASTARGAANRDY